MDFKNKNILAPMVRVTTLPMRLLALKLGADYVYSEEIVDFKLLRSCRVKNDIIHTIDFVMDDGTVVFRTCEEERGKIILQIATNDAKRALKVGKLLEHDVAAIDLNMGCPKPFSLKGGMGAEMLKDPDNACNILRTLSDNLSIPVTCKIRILPQMEKTIELVTKLADTGISAMTVHGRYPSDRPRHPVNDDIIKQISELIGNKITIIANGGSVDFIKKFEDINHFRELCGVSSVMIGRAAMWNPAIFNNNNNYSYRDIIDEYLKLAVRYDNNIASTKYCITQFLHEINECPGFRETLSSGSYEELCEIWFISEYYNEEMQRRNLLNPITDDVTDNIDIYTTDRIKHIKRKCRFNKRLYGKNGWSPKLELLQYCQKQQWDIPMITMEKDESNNLFFVNILLNNTLYSNETGDINKRFAEQAISCICLTELGLLSQDIIDQKIRKDQVK